MHFVLPIGLFTILCKIYLAIFMFRILCCSHEFNIGQIQIAMMDYLRQTIQGIYRRDPLHRHLQYSRTAESCGDV